MTTYNMWKNFYLWDFCTKDTLQLLVELGQLTQDEVNQIIASKPDLTGRVIKPIPKGESTQQATAQG